MEELNICSLYMKGGKSLQNNPVTVNTVHFFYNKGKKPLLQGCFVKHKSLCLHLKRKKKEEGSAFV